MALGGSYPAPLRILDLPLVLRRHPEAVSGCVNAKNSLRWLHWDVLFAAIIIECPFDATDKKPVRFVTTALGDSDDTAPSVHAGCGHGSTIFSVVSSRARSVATSSLRVPTMSSRSYYWRYWEISLNRPID